MAVFTGMAELVNITFLVPACYLIAPYLDASVDISMNSTPYLIPCNVRDNTNNVCVGSPTNLKHACNSTNSLFSKLIISD